MKALQRIRASIKKRGLSGVLRKIPDSRYQQEKNKRQNQLLERQDWDLYFEATLHELARRFTHRNDLYRYFDHHFDTILGETLKSHRSYFLANNRGFGENAFHSMWYQIFKEYRPKQILEIGVYRGQTLSLFSILSKLFETKSSVFGISPLSSAGDEVSDYLRGIDYAKDIASHHEFFRLPPATIVKAYSTDPAALELIGSKKWDLIYVDGSHDYDVVKSDYEVCKRNLNELGLLVFDDSSLYFDFDRSFKGHPGPSKLVNEVVSNEMELLIGVGHNNVFRLKA